MSETSDRAVQIVKLISELQTQGISDERVLNAIQTVPRDRFVASDDLEHAWANIALPIGAGQTISQPYVVAVMTAALALSGDERVLEIGTGSGYQSAILAQLAREIVSIERHSVLARGAGALLAKLGIENVEIHIGDGTLGWPDRAPYDGIIVTAAAPKLPPPLVKQLHPDGGRLVIPIGSLHDQRLTMVERRGERLTDRDLGPVRFVPLVGRVAWGPMSENGNAL